jgi:thiol-disulfide isomerase/thioredoxin
MNRRLFAVSVLALVVCAIVGFTLKLRAVAPRKSTLVAIGSPLPNLLVSTPQGQKVGIASISEGKKRVVVFYAPTCEACQKELPELTPFPPQLDLVMIREGESADGNAFRSEWPNTIRYIDTDKSFNRAFVMPALPTILFVDERGIVQSGLIGTHHSSVTRRELAKFAGVASVPGGTP